MTPKRIDKIIQQYCNIGLTKNLQEIARREWQYFLRKQILGAEFHQIMQELSELEEKRIST